MNKIINLFFLSFLLSCCAKQSLPKAAPNINYVLIGSPGAGKGTLSQNLMDYRYYKVGMGDIIREEVKKKTLLGLAIRNKMEKGHSIPDDIFYTIVSQKIQEAILTKKPFVLEGFPRTVKHFYFLLAFFKENNIDKNVTFIFINITAETAIKRIVSRLSCSKCSRVFNLITNTPKILGKCDVCGSLLFRRKEDNIHHVYKRIKIFQELTLPIIPLIEKDFKFITIDNSL